MRYFLLVVLVCTFVVSQGREMHAATDSSQQPVVSTSEMTEEVAQAIIHRLYRDILRREPDPSGLQAYTTALVSQSKDETWLRDVLLKSEEHQALLEQRAEEQARPSSPTTALTEEEAQNLIRRLYREILLREPDHGGLQNFTTFLVSQGKDEAWIREVLLHSLEKKTLRTWHDGQGIAFGTSLLLSAVFALIVRRSFHAKSSYQQALLYTIIATPILVYLFLVIHFAVNIPYGDDYDDILPFLSLPASERFSINAFFAQQNEHRVFVTRLISEIVYNIRGMVDFRLILFLNNLSLVGIAVLLGYIARSCAIGLPYFAPTMLVVFLTQMYGPMMRPSAQHHLVLFFAFLALVLWNHKTLLSSLLSMGAAFLATYSSGQGMFIYCPLLIWSALVLIPWTSQDKESHLPRPNLFGRLVLVLACGAGFITAYFSGYTSPSDPTSNQILTLLTVPWRALQFFLVTLGGYMNVTSLAFIAGAGAVAFFLFLTSKQYFNTRPVVYFFLLYLFLVALAGAITRLDFGIEAALASRYRNISILVLVCSYFAFLDLYTNRLENIRREIVTGVAAFFFFLNVFFVNKAVLELSQHRTELIEGLHAWRTTGAGLSYPPSQERASTVLQEAIRRGVYRIPEGIEAGREEKEEVRSEVKPKQ